MTDYNKYSDFTENEFIMDPVFQDWVMHPGAESNIFWQSFFEAYPHLQDAGKAAAIFLKQIIFKEDLPDEMVINRSLATHLQAVKRIENSKIVDFKRSFPMKTVLGIAAGFVGLILVASALYILTKKQEPVSFSTQYGEVRSLTLPDSSQVVLNAHSAIRFDEEWDKNDQREVWLTGEAFFNVNHINKDTNHIQKYERFIVHTKDVTVEVLGTSFDIRLRRGKTIVVLETGKIKVSFKNTNRSDIIMKPGEMLDYNYVENKLITATTSAEKFSAWKEKRLLLDNPTAEEIVQYLEDNFGKNIVLENSESGKRKIEGAVLLTNMDDALFVLSTVLNAEIIKNDSTIIVRPR
ncbi:FecR family protein [Flavitalea sp.]|nr:FecR domain-containing protein [Flavitalea sp.]